MKIPLVLLTLILALFTGCATQTNDPAAAAKRVASVVKLAAFNGTQLVLWDNPEWTVYFVQARNDLKALESQETIDFADVLIIVQRLPVKELRSNAARLIIGNASFALEEFGTGTDLATVDVRRIITALRTGIERGLPI